MSQTNEIPETAEITREVALLRIGQALLSQAEQIRGLRMMLNAATDTLAESPVSQRIFAKNLKKHKAIMDAEGSEDLDAARESLKKISRNLGLERNVH